MEELAHYILGDGDLLETLRDTQVSEPEESRLLEDVLESPRGQEWMEALRQPVGRIPGRGMEEDHSRRGTTRTPLPGQGGRIESSGRLLFEDGTSRRTSQCSGEPKRC